MGFMDSASYYVGRGIGSADKAAKNLKIQAEITKLESQKKDFIQQLGLAVYEKSKQDDAVSRTFSSYIAPITAAESGIAGCRKQLAELQNGSGGLVSGESGAVCPKCGRANPPSYSFCIGCGTKIEPIQTNGGDWVCTGCGASYNSEKAFCIQCGKPIRNQNEGQPKEGLRSEDGVSSSADGSGDPVCIDPESVGDSESEVTEAHEGVSTQNGIADAISHAKTSAVCPYCGSQIEPDDMFCGECGQSL